MKNLKTLIIFIMISAFLGCSKNNQKIKTDIVTGADEIPEESIENYMQKQMFLSKNNGKLIISDISLNSYSEISLNCLVDNQEALLVPAEDIFNYLGKTYEFCGRCGNITVNLQNENNDILLIEWNVPYVIYQNKAGKISLKHRNLYENGKTYTDFELFEYLGY